MNMSLLVAYESRSEAPSMGGGERGGKALQRLVGDGGEWLWFMADNGGEWW